MSSLKCPMKPTNKSEQKPLDRVASETLLALLTTNTKTEACKKLNIGRTALYARIDKYGLNTFLDTLPSHALGVLQQGGIEAAENFVNKLKSYNESISMDASREILDRIGVTKKSDNLPVGNQTNIQVIIEDYKEEEKQ